MNDIIVFYSRRRSKSAKVLLDNLWKKYNKKKNDLKKGKKSGTCITDIERAERTLGHTNFFRGLMPTFT